MSGRLHPFTLLFSSLDVARGFILPALLGGVSAGGDVGESVTWFLLIASVPAFLVALARFFSYAYRIEGDELIVDSGVFQRRHRVIPLSRVQNIDVRRSALQRLCGVAELRVETAGGSSTEAVLSVLSSSTAVALQTELLDRARAETASAESAPAGEVAVPGGEAAGPTVLGTDAIGERAPETRTLAALDGVDLMIAGATANEAGLIMAGIAGLAAQLPEDMFYRYIPWRFDPESIAPELPVLGLMLLMTAGVIGLVLVGWLFSVFGAFVRFYGFTLERTGDTIHKRYGLLSRTEGTVPLERVQALRIEESLLRRPLGLAALKIETAGGSARGQQNQRSSRSEAFLPLTRAERVPDLISAIFEDCRYAGLRFLPVHPRSRRRALVRYSWPVLAAAAAAWLLLGVEWLALLALLPACFLAAHLNYRNRGYAVTERFAFARSGFFNRVTWVVPRRRVQTLHVTETPFQRRHGLASVVVDTAAGRSFGRAEVVDLARPDALDVFFELASSTNGDLRNDESGRIDAG